MLHSFEIDKTLECLESEGDIVIASVCMSVRLSVLLSPPKPLDGIQPNLVCKLPT